MLMTQKSDAKGCHSGMEIQVRNLLDVTFRYTWVVEDYLQHMSKGCNLDSEPFEVNANGLRTKWSLAIRFWTGPDGEQLSNPVVVCLNLVSVAVDVPEEARLRYQFGIFNDVVKQYELMPASGADIVLETNETMSSVGYKDVCVLERHRDARGDIRLQCRIMLVLRRPGELHTLPLDLLQMLVVSEHTDATLCAEGKEFGVHRAVLSARSPVFAAMFKHDMREALDGKVHIEDITPENLQALLHYVYTDRVENIDIQAQALLPVAEKYQLIGLKDLCEKALIDAITPSNVATMLLMADSFQCEGLKRAALAYCEDNANCIVKNVGWKVMEEVHPELFQQACEVVVKDSCACHMDCVRQDSPKGEVRVP